MRKYIAFVLTALALFLVACGMPSEAAYAENTTTATAQAQAEDFNLPQLPQLSNETITQTEAITEAATDPTAQHASVLVDINTPTSTTVPAITAATTTTIRPPTTCRGVINPLTGRCNCGAHTAPTSVPTTTATRSASTSPPAPTRPGGTPPPVAASTVRFGIDGSAAPGFGVILPAQTMVLQPGDTAFSLLQRSGVAINYTRSFLGVYVSAIGGLRERTAGGQSGWVFEVNGQRPSMSADRFVPRTGDEIVWRFVLTI